MDLREETTMSSYGSASTRRGRRRFALRAAALAAALAASGGAAAQQSAPPLRIGILSDMAGIVADLSGPGSVIAAKMAIQDFGGKVIGRQIELIEADHQNKADLGISLARQWYDSGVRAIFDIGITTVATGVQQLARDKDRIVVFNSSASSDLTGKLCSPNGVHWTYNSYSQALGAVKAAQDAGAKSWYFITVDYAYGKNVQRDATEMIQKAGGKVVGSVAHPFDSTEFSSQLLQAQTSKADAIGLATTTGHAATMIKQAAEFGVTPRQIVAPMSLTFNDVRAVGLQAAQGLYVTEPFYWDQSDETRRFSNRFRDRHGKMPNMVQASVYGAVTHYLKAVAAAGTDDTSAVMAKMRSLPINDMMTKDGTIREDGRVMRENYIFRVKKPAESKNTWDLYVPVSTISRNDSFPPDKACALLR
jgi:branched-chain amino acid transport system substrate-binding protein